MELKTEMQWTKDGVCRPDPYSLTIHSPTDTIPESFADFVHDTIAAHALMQAMETLRAEFLSAGITGSVGCAIVWEVQSRADELMQEWTRS